MFDFSFQLKLFVVRSWGMYVLKDLDNVVFCG